MSPPPLPSVATNAAATSTADRWVAAPACNRTPLGQMLVEMGLLSPADKLRSLAMQSRVQARLGHILMAQGLIDKPQLYTVIARQFDTDVADFSTTPPDIRLIDAIGVARCLAEGILPWQRRDGRVLIATARPEEFARRAAGLEALFGPVRMVIAAERDIHHAVLDKHPLVLLARAESRVPETESCRAWGKRGLPIVVLALLCALLLGALLAPGASFLLLVGWAILTLVSNSVLKITAVLRQVLDTRTPATPARPLPQLNRLPSVSILVPLYKEREIAGRLIARLARLKYPLELLDICLIVEADDEVTCNTLDAIALPDHIRQIVVPQSSLRTKPRALNYALDFCRGDIIGVYDAEDAPAPDQITRIVHRFHEVGPEVACLQGTLDFYNARSNWFSRCFTIEYATWFRVILPGLAKMGLVIPLGGTTLFFRRRVLDELGGWDAHNVTEDADLGVRLARRGYRTELVDTVTEEEANCRLWPWIKQRSRWLKGYAITWAVHSRNPCRLWRDLGPFKFFGVQMLFLGTLSQFLLAPVLWSFWLVQLGWDHPMQSGAAKIAMALVITIFVLSELINIGIGIYATHSDKHRFLMPWVPTLYFYYPLAALASYKGVLELLTRPFYWDKTSHGLFDAPDGHHDGRHDEPHIASGARPTPDPARSTPDPWAPPLPRHASGGFRTPWRYGFSRLHTPRRHRRPR